MLEENPNPDNALPKIYFYIFLQKYVIKMSMIPLKMTNFITIKNKIVLNVYV